MKTLKHLLVGALVAAAAFSMAQQGGGRMMMGMGGGQQPDAFLVMSPDVQKDIKITPEQKLKLDKMSEDFRANMPRPGGGGGGGGFDPSAFQTMMKDAADKINAVLDDKQKVRLKEIGIQTAGGRALFREDVQKDLDMKAAQKKTLNDLQTKMQEATMELFQSMRDQAITREEMQASMTKNNATLSTEAIKVLTPEQAAAFEKMKGAKFEGTVAGGMFGRGGGRGQGGGGRGQGGQPPRTGGAGQPPL